MAQNNYPPSAEMDIRNLQERIKALEAAVQTRVPLNTITGGALQVQDAGGNVLAYIGDLGSTYPDGSHQYGIEIIRQAEPGVLGGLALALLSFSPGVLPQTLNMWDANGNPTYADDGQSGFGLARPFLGIPMCSSATAAWPSTTSASMADMWFSWPNIQHPKMYFQGYMNAPSGTNAQIQAITGTTVLGSPITVNGLGGPAGWTLGPVAWPAGQMYGVPTDLRIQAARTAGTGTVQVGLGIAYGQQS